MGMRHKINERRGLRELCKWIRQDHGSCGSLIEIGSFMGDSARIFLEYFEEVTCVDPWKHDPKFEESLTRSHDATEWARVEKIFDVRALGAKKLKMTSDEASILVGHFDVVYIDAVHTYEAVSHDVITWRDKAKYIAGHDYSKRFPGVKKAVHEQLRKPDATFQDSSWIVKI